MQYTVVHSKDPYLLARLATDLQMEGFDKLIHFPNIQHPFHELDGRSTMKWCDIYDNKTFNFQNHECDGDIILHELTSRNYIKVLTQILQP
jgi:fido (protein-threonine AMPylation protein)